MRLTFELEQPDATAPQDPLIIRVEGWLHAGERHGEIRAVEVFCGGDSLGATQLLFPRPDVAARMRAPANAPLGFALALNAPALFGRPHAEFELRARLSDGTRVPFVTRTVPLIADDERRAPYGLLLNRDETRVLHRDDIYGSGPSVHEINPDCIALVRRYLAPAPRCVLDVGCGFGGYGRALRADGHDWFGVEVKASDCAELTKLGLPHQQVDGRTLPFEPGAFEDAICIEVLEHTRDPNEFLAEIRRVIRRRLIVSVPNLELIPRLFPHAVVPWHLLEADHRNFFSRASLQHLLAGHFPNVEVIDYAPLPLRALHGGPLHIHLMAICDI